MAAALLPSLPFPACDRARELVQRAIECRTERLRSLVALCESPIEEILLISMWDHWGCRVAAGERSMEALIRLEGGISRLAIEPQREIATGASLYRADFLVYLMPHVAVQSTARFFTTVVEVDGHDFHERTQLQAARDRQRDRALLLEGLRTVRFTGSEVFNRPDDCVRELDALFRQGSAPNLVKE